MDWNLIVRLLDELRDGPRLVIDLQPSILRCDPEEIAQSLIYLAERQLVATADDPELARPIDQRDLPRRLRKALSGAPSDAPSMAITWVDLTPKGVEVLRLFGIGSL